MTTSMPYLSYARCLCLIIGCLSIGKPTWAQNIPIGNWRIHYSFHSIQKITSGQAFIYAAGKNGLVVLDKSDNTITTLSTIEGLSGSEISDLQFHNPSNSLLITYADGQIDLINNQIITSYNQLNQIDVNGSKRINHISFHENMAYLATDYGVVVFDLTLKQIKETWRDLGKNGNSLSINQSTFLGDSIFLSTDLGIIVGNLNDNLLDYNNWKRFDENEFNTAVSLITVFNNCIYIAIDGDGIYSYKNGIWTRETFLENSTYTFFQNTSSSLLIGQDGNIWNLSISHSLSPITTSQLTYGQAALEDNGTLWIGDIKNGIVTNNTGIWKSLVPNGPAFDKTVALNYFNNSIYATQGGYDASRAPLGNLGVSSQFSNGIWTSVFPSIMDITSISYKSTSPVYASFGQGIASAAVIYNEDNSTLINTTPPDDGIFITDLKNNNGDIWAINYGASYPLHVWKADGTWQRFSFPYPEAQFPLQLTFDTNENIWLVLDPNEGGGIVVFNPFSNEYIKLTNLDGSGGLPSKNVNAIAVDRNGYSWIGTDNGIAYFVNPNQVFSGNINAIKPIVEGRYALSNQKVSSIQIDGGNRLWIGTNKGVWLFDPDQDAFIKNFTTENSPLPSSEILDMAIDHNHGEIFMATESGLASYRADATEGGDYSTVKVFPNPVPGNFSGTVGISGLATDATLKITDIGGKLIWETKAEGGTATWNTRDLNGVRPKTGIYLLFSALPDGSERYVGKIAVLE